MDCQLHGEDVKLVCIQCDNEVVCSQCLNGNHKGHHVNTIENVVTSGRDRIRSMYTKITKSVSDYDVQLKELKDEDNVQIDSINSFTKEVKGRGEMLHELVDKASKIFVDTGEKTAKLNSEKLKEQADLIQQDKSKALTFQEKLKDILACESGLQFLQRAKKIDWRPLPKVPVYRPTVHHLEKTNADIGQIQAMFGNVIPRSNDETSAMIDATDFKDPRQTISFAGSDTCSKIKSSAARPDIIRSVTNFTTTANCGSDFTGTIEVKGKFLVTPYMQHSSKTNISVLEPFGNDKCWVRCIGESQIKLIDEKGQVHQSVVFESDVIKGLGRGKDDTVYVCSQGPNIIKKVCSKTGSVEKLFSTGSLIPLDICCLSSGELLVALVSDLGLSVSSGSERMLIKFTGDGKEIKRVKKDECKDKIFTLPFIVRTNSTRSLVAVLNCVSPTLSYLLLFDAQLRLQLRYIGNNEAIKGHKKFKIKKSLPPCSFTDVIFNSEDTIILCEEFSKTVQLLNATCEVISVLSLEEEIPWRVAVTESKMWVACGVGWVKVWHIS